MFPSRVEGFGLPPLEAMQCGVPVVCAKATSLPEVVGEAGFLLDPDDDDAWCQALLNLYEDSDLRATLARQSQERAKRFSWQRCARQTLDAYNVALKARGA